MRKDGFEKKKWRPLTEALPLGARSFELEPMYMRVFSPFGAFHVLQNNFYGKVILDQIQNEARDGRVGKPKSRMPQSSGREASQLSGRGAEKRR